MAKIFYTQVHVGYVSCCSTICTESPLTVETVCITPSIKAAPYVQRVDRLRIDDDDVVQLCDLVVARGSSIYVSDVPPERVR